MLFRTRLRPAAQLLVSLELDSTLPSWWPTAWTSTLALLTLVHLDTSGLQTGKRRGGRGLV